MSRSRAELSVVLTVLNALSLNAVAEPRSEFNEAAQGPVASNTHEAEPSCELGLTGSWNGARQALIERGITLGLTATFEANRVLSGGLHHPTSAHALYDLSVNFDLTRIAGIPDAVISIDAYSIDGHNPSADVGDFQSFSDISGPREITQVAEVFYEQWFFDRTARVKFGKMDSALDFMSPTVVGEGFHSSAAFSPTNFAPPFYPNPAGGALIAWAPTPEFGAKIGVYDGAGWTGVNTGSRWPNTFFGAPSDLVYMAQLEHRWSLGHAALSGGCVVGGWHHTGEFERASGGTDDSTRGWFAAVDQELDHEDHGDRVSNTLAVMQVGFADAEVAPLDVHAAFGVCWNGCAASRPDDSVGGYVSWAHFGDDAGFTASAETAFELFYKWSCCPNVLVRPNLQYIVDPGGDSDIDAATVASVRVEITL